MQNHALQRRSQDYEDYKLLFAVFGLLAGNKGHGPLIEFLNRDLSPHVRTLALEGLDDFLDQKLGKKPRSIGRPKGSTQWAPFSIGAMKSKAVRIVQARREWRRRAFGQLRRGNLMEICEEVAFEVSLEIPGEIIEGKDGRRELRSAVLESEEIRDRVAQLDRQARTSKKSRKTPMINV